MEGCIHAQSYVNVFKTMIDIIKAKKTHTPIRTRTDILCGIGNCRKEKHVQRGQKHKCAVKCFYLVEYHHDQF